MSKKLQSPSMYITALSTLQQIEGMMNDFDTYGNEGFASSMITTKLVFEMIVEPLFSVKHCALGKHTLMKLILVKQS